MMGDEKIKSLLSKLLDFDQIAKVEVNDLPGNLSTFQCLKTVNVHLKENGKVVHYIVKILSDAHYRSQYFKSFHNEIIMYSEVLSAMSDKVHTMIPKWFYATPLETIGDEETAIVVSNLSVEGYGNNCNKAFLTIDEVKFAMKTLGYFHGEGYSLKFKNKLEQFTEKLHNHFFELRPGTLYEYSRNVADASLFMFLDRLINRNLNEQLVTKAKKMKATISKKTAWGMVKELRNPVEPYAVLCHGDFNANNVLFKYSPDGNVVDCKMIDFQLPVYTQPQIDMVFMLFINIDSPEERAEHWDDMWKIYHDALVERIKFVMGATFDIPEYLSLNTFKAEMPKYLFHGMFIISFFLPYNNQSEVYLKMISALNELRMKLPQAVEKHRRIIAGQLTECSADNDNSLLDELTYDPKMEEMVTPYMTAMERDLHIRYLDEVLLKKAGHHKIMDDLTEEFLASIDESLYE